MVLPDNRVLFRIHAPGASDVSLDGDWLASPEPLTMDNNGFWSVTVGPLASDYYTYAFSVDGVYTLDPGNTEFKPGSDRVQNIFLVPGEAIAFAATQSVPHGDIRKMWYDSPTMNSTRRMHVYTPPLYDSSDEKYPVLYLLHGGGEDDAGWITIGRAGFILDNLLVSGRIKPMIVVMPHGQVDFPGLSIRRSGIDWKSPESVARVIDILSKQHDMFVEDLVGTIIPSIESKLRVLADRDYRAIAGLSMGGAQTIRAALTNLNRFAYFGVFSVGIVAVRADFDKTTAEFFADPVRTNESVKLFYVAAGREDKLIGGGARQMSESLRRRGIDHQFHESDGGHTWINWRRYLYDFAPRLFR